MTQMSENCTPLKIRDVEIRDIREIKKPDSSQPAVWFFVMPYDSSRIKVNLTDDFYERLNEFAQNADEQTILCFQTVPQTASELVLNLQGTLHYKLWISIKCKEKANRNCLLPYEHSELLILGKYKENLRHAKTRVPYTYCPACDKTTKDYGGKKHTYHEYGTLMSDVWRDITVAPDEYPELVVDRLSHLFGLPPYRELCVVDMSQALKYEKRRAVNKTYDLTKVNGLNEKFHNILINDDCLEALKKIPSNSIDYCFADPPYNLKKKYDNWNDNLDIHEYFIWCDRWLYELGRVVKPGCFVTVLNIPLWAVRHYEYLKEIMNFQRWITWEGLSLPVRMIMPANYSILCFSKGHPRILNFGHGEELLSLKDNYCLRQSCINSRENDRKPVTDLWWDIHRLKHNTRRADHPCQLPPALMRRLIALFTNEEEVVLDPFNGVATTTLSAQQMNRKYIGIELSEKYHKIAQERHKELLWGLDPFRKNGDTPKAKNSSVPRLKKQKYLVPKKELQLEVKRIVQKIGKLPTKEEVKRYSKYPIEYYENYFISWGEVCAAARTTGMVETRKSNKNNPKNKQLELF
ncbi:MAG: site-specific DNA-methyltransferase [Sedimentisphaerales bacterium]|nr:site-specific DNA-methyltransferase [Sedimentisphaerales bacterium]